MKMPEKLYNVLKDKLGDEKVTLDGKETSVLDLIAGDDGLWKLSREVLPKVKENNADLVKQREEWEKKEKGYKEDLKSKDGEIDKLKTGQLTENERKEWLKIKEKGMTSDVEAKFNAQADMVKTLTESIDALKKEIETEKSNRVNASKEGALQKMRNDVMIELGKHKIEGDGADLAFTHLSAKGYAQLSEKDGSFSPVYRLIKDGKELESDLPGMVKAIAESDLGKRLATGTRGGGTGDNHESRPNGSGDRPSTREMMNMRGDASYDKAT